jgi:hypothetical protein
VNVPSSGAARVRDARLTRLADPVTVGATGATVVASYTGPAGEGDVELEIPTGAVPDGSEVRLTVLSPQALIASVPLG